MLLGIDIGGTFTDFVLADDEGRLRVHKLPTTTRDPAGAVRAGAEDLQLPHTARVVHGSTIATNALLERRGARTALITTAGFADVLEIGRQHRPTLYALVPYKPPPLVPRAWRFEVRERVTAQGEVLVPLDPEAVAALKPALLAEGIESVAVCFLFSFLHPEHERAARAKLESPGSSADDEPGLDAPPPLSISLSADILPEYREFERVATTVINAYVAPLVDRYLAGLEHALSPRPLRIMQSNGGSISSTLARRQAARTVLSGPAGGVVGAFACARAAGEIEAAPSTSEGEANVITFDMGGTSTDVCLCPGHIPFTSECEISALGLPLRLPIIDIHTVGAGGGSLARVDAGGALTVGPESAGADPGPACYGRGGRAVTVTDANLLLGRLDPAHFLGGRMTLDTQAARTAMAELAGVLGSVSLEAAAWGVLQIANATMERAIRRISVERGFDPRAFTLVAFGGAGPLHACELAERLGMPRVLVPRAPGVLSALGMLLADLVKDYSLTIMRRADRTSAAELRQAFGPLEDRARAEMAQEGIPAPRLERSVDARYAGQSFEINVPLPGPAPSVEAVVDDFHQRHAQRYGHARPDQPVELVNLRVRAVGQTPKPVFEAIPTGGDDPSRARLGRGSVWFAGQHGAEALPTPQYARGQLQSGNRLEGPALIFQLDATTVLPPGWAGRVDGLGNLLFEKR